MRHQRARVVGQRGVGAELAPAGEVRRHQAVQAHVVLVRREYVDFQRQGDLVLAGKFFERWPQAERIAGAYRCAHAAQHVHVLAQQTLHVGQRGGGRRGEQDLDAGARLEGEVGEPGVGVAGGDFNAAPYPGLDAGVTGVFVRLRQRAQEGDGPLWEALRNAAQQLDSGAPVRRRDVAHQGADDGCDVADRGGGDRTGEGEGVEQGGPCAAVHPGDDGGYLAVQRRAGRRIDAGHRQGRR